MRAFACLIFSEDLLQVWIPGDRGINGRIVLRSWFIDGRYPALELDPAIDLNVFVDTFHDIDLVVGLRGPS
jgi:hypothetical protein